MIKRKLAWKVLACICAIVLGSCGGGAGTGGTTAGSSGGATASSALSGTVAVGAPMLNATLTVMGANGQSVSTAVDDSGSYANLNVTALTAPYRLQACGQADGQYVCYYAVVQSIGVADVTPLTDAVVALALGTDASALFTGSVPSASALASSEASLRNYLGPLLAAAGVSSTGDFATLPFTADHTGMDKVLDAVKITTGHNNSAMYVQMEGVLGYGNAYVDSQGNQSGSLDGSALVNGMSVNLTGISTIFSGLNSAVGSGSLSACESTISAQVPFDGAFSLELNDTQLTAATAPAALCSFASTNGLLGGKVANPALQSCDFGGTDKFCTVDFDLSNGTLDLQGAEMTVVLRQNATTWTLLGNENPYGIQVGSAVSRSLNVDVPNSQPTYTRNLSFDIPDTVVSGSAPHAAKVYVHDASGTGTWDSTPIAVLNDSCGTSSGNLTMAGSNCGGEWLSIDNFSNSEIGTGDLLIDALYHRGLDLKIDLYSDASATTPMTTVYTRLNGLPPKAADLPNVPWLNLDAASQSALAAYASSTVSTQTLTLAWSANPVVVPHDLTFCSNNNCSSEVHMELPGTSIQTGATMNLSTITVIANGYKRLSLYGRDRNDVGYESDYLTKQPT